MVLNFPKSALLDFMGHQCSQGAHVMLIVTTLAILDLVLGHMMSKIATSVILDFWDTPRHVMLKSANFAVFDF